jgi:hypothetical protein
LKEQAEGFELACCTCLVLVSETHYKAFLQPSNAQCIMFALTRRLSANVGVVIMVAAGHCFVSVDRMIFVVVCVASPRSALGRRRAGQKVTQLMTLSN